MIGSKYRRFLLKAVMAFAVFIGIHFLMTVLIRHEPYHFDLLLDLLAPIIFTIVDTIYENRRRRK